MMEKFPKFPNLQKKYITNEDNNIIRVYNKIILLLIFMSDIFFCICLMQDVSQLFSILLTDYE